MAKKKPKPTTKQPDEPQLPPETTAAIASSIFAESLTAIRKEIRGIADGSIEPGEHDAVSRIAWLAEKASKVEAERRKAEKSELDVILRISYAVMVTWAKKQTTEVRARLVRDITAIDATERRSVLG
jgi:hypothetical protein